MPGQPLYEYTLVRRTISPATRSSSINGDPVDRAVDGGNHEAIVAIITGAISDGTHVVSIEDSSDGTTGWAEVPADQLIGQPPTIGSGDDSKIFEVGVVVTRRFLRASIAVTGALTGGGIGVVIVLGEMRFNPVTR